MLAAAIEVKRERGVMVVKAIGRTGRGQRYIKAHKRLSCKNIADPKFKVELAAAISELLGNEA